MSKHIQGPRISNRIKQQLNQEGTSLVAEKTEDPLSTDEGQAPASSEPEKAILSDPETIENNHGQSYTEFQKKNAGLVAETEKDAMSSLEKALTESVDGKPRTKGVQVEPLEIKATITREELDAELEKYHPLMQVDRNSGKVSILPEGLGQQSDGTFKVILVIPEGLIEPIRQEAETNEKTVSEWCSEQFGFFMESWWAGPKSR